MIAVAGPTFVLEAHPALRDESREPLLRLDGKRRRRLQSAADFRRVDAEQPNAADASGVDRVAVDNVAHQDRRRASLRDGRRGTNEQDGDKKHDALTTPLIQVKKTWADHTGRNCKPATTALDIREARTPSKTDRSERHNRFQRSSMAIPDQGGRLKGRRICNVSPGCPFLDARSLTAQPLRNVRAVRLKYGGALGGTTA